MRRRQFITLLGGAAATWPFAVWAQQPMPVIGFLSSTSPKGYKSYLAAFHEGLGEAGFVEGKNVTIEYRWAEDHYERLPELAADLVRHRVALIAATGGSPAALAAKSATTTIPIVFQIGVDPVKAGLVSSLSRPGGNITGFANLALEIGPKRLELLHGLVPNATDLVVLINPTRSNAEAETKDMQAAADRLRVRLHVLRASSEQEFENVFSTSAQLRVGGVVISGDPFFNTRSEQLAAMAVRYAMPAIYQFHEFAAAGGLASYGSSIKNTHREAGIYTGRILKGEKPADLPVQEPTKVELIVNLKTAKILGLAIPPSVLTSADEVIE
jgi:putative tryptophan/tyrosine transport system substrate-binding protein